MHANPVYHKESWIKSETEGMRPGTRQLTIVDNGPRAHNSVGRVCDKSYLDGWGKGKRRCDRDHDGISKWRCEVEKDTPIRPPTEWNKSVPRLLGSISLGVTTRKERQ